MATVYFFEKPGCINNARQKKLLIASGHTVIDKNLLTHPWTPNLLLSFLGSKSVHSWFNLASPRIKSKEILPENISTDAALELMIHDPLLIKRPLLQVENRCESGFDQNLIHNWIGLSGVLKDPEKCKKNR